MVISFLDGKGEVIESQAHSVPARGHLDLWSSGTGLLKVGPLTVVSELGEDSLLRGSLVYELLGHRVSIPTATPTPKATVFVSKSAEENTGIALFNPSLEEPVDLEIALHVADGSDITSIDITLEPGQHLARYLDEAPLFPDVLGPRTEFAGHAVIRSTEGGHFVVASLLQNTMTGSVALVTPGIE